MNSYGKELILDLEYCDVKQFTRPRISLYVERLCRIIKVERGDLHFWDYAGAPEEYDAAPDHIKGTSAIQFILTSNITIHTLDVLKTAYFNIFSCDDFDERPAVDFTAAFFDGKVRGQTVLLRGEGR